MIISGFCMHPKQVTYCQGFQNNKVDYHVVLKNKESINWDGDGL